MYTKVIAKKGRPYPNPALGVIIPVFIEEENGKYIPATKAMFPDDGEIFIYSGFNNINKDFQENELFEISDIRKSNDTTKSCQYSATANDYEALPPIKFIPIVDGKFDSNHRALKYEQGVNYSSFFFMRTGNFIYGPLVMDYENNWRPIKNDDERFMDIEENNFSHIQDNHDCVLEFKAENLNGHVINDYIVDLNHLLKQSKYTTIYAGTKEDTITWARNNLPGALAASKAESDFWKKMSSLSLPNISLPSVRQKFEAFNQYVGEVNDVINVALPNLFDRYLETDAGKASLAAYLSENATAFFIQYRRDEFSAVDKELEMKKEQLGAFQLEIDSLTKNLEAKGEKILEGVDENEKELLRQIIKNENDRKKILALFRSNESLEKINEKVQRLEGQSEYLEKDAQRRQNAIVKLEEKEKVITAAIVNVKDKFFKEDEFATRLLETKIYSDILNNIDPGFSSEKGDESNVSAKAVQVFSGQLEAIELVNEIAERFSFVNRKIEPNDIVNYLVTLHQNFLTVFAGAPGVGKTSLVTKLSQVLGSYYFDRFLPVSVQKGWTSTKDLIGYYNPITRRYQPSKTGMYQLLKILEKDTISGNEYPSIVLLDEANLSPIEHYWSEFSNIADEDCIKLIKITDQETVAIGKAMRFVATINYDHTTEVLSERLISRAPIIKLTKGEMSLMDETIPAEIMPIFEYNKLEHWLKPHKENYKHDVKARFEAIIKKLEDEEDAALGIPIIISPRKQRAVEKYCAAATSLMKSNTPLVALDYAVNQHILPLISGRGDTYKRRLLALQEKLHNMPLSSKHLEKIIQAGDNNFKYYKFFY